MAERGDGEGQMLLVDRNKPACCLGPTTARATVPAACTPSVQRGGARRGSSGQCRSRGRGGARTAATARRSNTSQQYFQGLALPYLRWHSS